MAAIRAAGIAEFTEKGLAGTSTQSIAERAGLTKPQLHYYIAGKEALYEELLMSAVADWKGIFDAGSADPGKVLGDYIRSKVHLAFDKPEVSRIFTREVLDGGRNLDRFWPDSRKRTRGKVAAINGWIARGLMAPVDAHMLLMGIWAMTQFYADSALQVRQLPSPVSPTGHRTATKWHATSRSWCCGGAGSLRADAGSPSARARREKASRHLGLRAGTGLAISDQSIRLVGQNAVPSTRNSLCKAAVARKRCAADARSAGALAHTRSRRLLSPR